MDSVPVVMGTRSAPYRIVNAESIGVSINYVAQCEEDPSYFTSQSQRSRYVYTSPDILNHDATVLTVDNNNHLYRNGTVVVDNGVIRMVRPSEPEDADKAVKTVIDGSDRLVMPGLVNAHLELAALTGAFSEMDLGEMFAEMTALCEQLGRTRSRRPLLARL